MRRTIKDEKRAMHFKHSADAPAQGFHQNHQKIAGYVKCREFDQTALNEIAIQAEQLTEEKPQISSGLDARS